MSNTVGATSSTSAVVLIVSSVAALGAQQPLKAAAPAERRSLPQLLAESGFRYSKVSDSTWRTAANGSVLDEIAVFVAES